MKRLTLDKKCALYTQYLSGVGPVAAGRAVGCCQQTVSDWYEKFRDGVVPSETCSGENPRTGKFGITRLCYVAGCDSALSGPGNFCERHSFKPPEGHDLARLMAGRA